MLSVNRMVENFQRFHEIYDSMEKTGMVVDMPAAEWIFNFLREKKIERTLDVGLGEGASAMAVMLATQKKHVAIDPLLFTTAGVRNVEQFGFNDQLELIKFKSAAALADLWREGRTFEYTFIDAGNKIDDLFTDFYFVSQMTELNGYIFIPDMETNTATLLKFLSFIRNCRPDFEIHPIPQDTELTILKKVSQEDNRSWGHYIDF